MAETEEAPKAAPALPSVDDVLAKYVQALGGEQALRKVTSRLITATWELPTGPGETRRFRLSSSATRRRRT